MASHQAEGHEGGIQLPHVVDTMGTTSGAPRGALERRLRRWSRPTFLDDVIAELDGQSETHGVLTRTVEDGITEHADKFAAIEYLQDLLRKRREAHLHFLSLVNMIFIRGRTWGTSFPRQI